MKTPARTSEKKDKGSPTYQASPVSRSTYSNSFIPLPTRVSSFGRSIADATLFVPDNSRSPQLRWAERRLLLTANLCIQTNKVWMRALDYAG